MPLGCAGLNRSTLARAGARLNRKAHSPLTGLVLMTDAKLYDPVAAARALPKGAPVIVRAKTAAAKERLAAKLAGVARERALMLLISADDRLAARLGAGGVHLPESEAYRAADLRARHPDWIITSSAHSARALRRALGLPLDAVFLSPVFATRSHPGAAPLSPLRAFALARASLFPVYALGGIDAASVRRLADSPFAGIAIVGGWVA